MGLCLPPCLLQSLKVAFLEHIPRVDDGQHTCPTYPSLEETLTKVRLQDVLGTRMYFWHQWMHFWHQDVLLAPVDVLLAPVDVLLATVGAAAKLAVPACTEVKS